MPKEIDVSYHPEKIDPSVHVAQGAVVIGDVTIGKDTSIWYNSVLRGDMDRIVVGERCNIQDCAVVHTDWDAPTTIGNDVTVGHGAVIHGATVEDEVLVAVGAIILNWAHIGRNSIIGAGAVIPERRVIPPNSVVAGVPGQVIGTVDEKRLKYIQRFVGDYLRLKEAYGDNHRIDE